MQMTLATWTLQYINFHMRYGFLFSFSSYASSLQLRQASPLEQKRLLVDLFFIFADISKICFFLSVIYASSMCWLVIMFLLFLCHTLSGN